MKVEHLTFTRFVAAILVVLFHIGVNKFDPESVVSSFVKVGDSAVSYFFVLSGFILVVSNVRNGQLPLRIPMQNFWRNRFARIYPLYLFALILTIALGLLSDEARFKNLSADNVAASALLIQAWLPQFAMQLNYPGWSLSVETLFYLLFPLLYFLMIRQSTGWLAFLTALFWVFSLVSFVAMTHTHLVPEFILYFPPVHLNTFLVGITTGIVFVRHQAWLTRYWRWITLVLVLLLIGNGWIVVKRLSPYFYHHNGFFAPLFSVFILWLAVQKNDLSRWLSQPLPIRLGEISYGIYLLQVPVGMLTFYTNYHFLHWPAWLYIISYVAILSITSLVCYYRIEQPARRLIRRRAVVSVKEPVSGPF